jgi:hypothetical protein
MQLDQYLWWRDDDLTEVTPQFEQLLALHEAMAIPLFLAVIPDGVKDEVRDRIRDYPEVWVLQHGISHKNNGLDGKKCELNACSPTILKSLKTGFDRLSELFKEQFLPILVPPWNRINDSLLSELDEIGFKGLSREGRRVSYAQQLHNIDTHILWKNETNYIGIENIEKIAKGEPYDLLGFLTHHLVHDHKAWNNYARLMHRHKNHPWLNGAKIKQLLVEAN